MASPASSQSFPRSRAMSRSTPRLISGMATYGLSEELLAAVIDGLGRKIAEQRSQPQDSGTGTARVKIKTAKNLKVGDISVIVTSRSRDAVLEELEKCELVCANCHVMRTVTRMTGVHRASS